ncbi:hypothetical protein CI105_07020 [Candidatus Izimaplasma bacterium ZiA1]|uniref:HD-GYP domain-containing protein n=1 Tax=Candidatus Izimoplasma sp. ZiA1 TaxID=2024899 RepID=UPI000BAA4E2D|nr:hypothetical protein CI105_07020 [Candidatus Izimaplasma bacterium ZiA1]
MEKITLKELAVPLIKAIDSFNYLLKSHHRRTAVISYFIAKEMKLSEEEMTNLVISAALHDIGALSVQERDTLIKEDVDNPKPHCLMGYKMLSSFKLFEKISQIIKHHHIKYEELDNYDDEILIQSHIIHFADRIDIMISPDFFILDQKESITKKMTDKTGTIFNPIVLEAFLKASKPDIFWININNMTLEQLFNKISFNMNYQMTLENVVVFAQTISRIVDYRSQYTSTHSYTVAHLAYHIAKILELPQEECVKLLVAGYFHDIGKIGIDPGIIEKKGPLTSSEFNIMKLHSYYSKQILLELSSSHWFEDIIKWTSQHHEKIDGSGYPYAIEKEDFDLGTKILAYSDILSALMEERPYRRKLNIDEAFNIIDKELAHKIDELIYDLLISKKDEIEQVYQQCRKDAEHFYEAQANI